MLCITRSSFYVCLPSFFLMSTKNEHYYEWILYIYLRSPLHVACFTLITWAITWVTTITWVAITWVITIGCMFCTGCSKIKDTILIVNNWFIFRDTNFLFKQFEKAGFTFIYIYIYIYYLHLYVYIYHENIYIIYIYIYIYH